MRASIFFTAPLVALVAAQSQSSSTVDAFPLASLLTQTDSRGVVTGQPAVQTSMPSIPAVVTSQPSQPAVVTSQPGQPAVVTSQPAADSIPAGLAPGLHTLAYGNATSFIISIGSSTTIFNPGATTSSSSGSAGGVGAIVSSVTGTDGKPTPTTLGMTTTGGQSQVTSTSKPAAAAGLKAASGAMAGAAAVFALWL